MANGPSEPEFVVDQPGGNLTLDLFVLEQRLGSYLEAALAGVGVTPAQYAVYSQLASGATTPGSLMEILGLRAGTLSGYLAAMERRGDLSRVRNPADGRSALLTLTEQGQERRRACRLRMARAVRLLDRHLGGPDRVTALRRDLGRVHAGLANAHDDLTRTRGRRRPRPTGLRTPGTDDAG